MVNDSIDYTNRYLNDYGPKGASSLAYDIAFRMTQEQKSEMFNHFKNKGYDAIYDPEDSNHIDNSEYLFNQPIVVLDPKNSIRVAGREYIDMKEWDNYIAETVEKLG